tara:strand:+ start:90 stop:506 length:417 start_codon:yes stop_codon:yes gene_type:complete
MRVRYTFTSDIDEVPDKVKYNLQYFKEQEESVGDSLQKIVEQLSKRSVDYESVLLEIEDVRLLMGKLDLLLQESSNVLAACQSAQSPTQELEVPEPVVEEKEEKKPVTGNRDPEKVAQLQAAMQQLNSMTSTLQGMKK